ncbi:SGNH/GDSL hydrolase family protein [Paramicrobacterium agarici]|uniref:SGNH/GDSL hydrolase family protein n=1 Tax=Paramicrobacterium agarici TaxID=630514 RepID=UPI0011538AF4|nr:SGNH/GDSL hydrolase family protein [Microbacterium agarici]TQO22163.1 lysophospholipase L1-like esterase [Microbacterium agarici]
MIRSYVAVGDSFTEGVGDDRPDGSVRGWADFVAIGLQAASADPIGYANLAIRGRKLGPIVDEQLESALALGADMLTFNGGGNDIMRPRVKIDWVVERTMDVVDRTLATDTRPVILAGANPSRHLPLGRLIRSRGDELAEAVADALGGTGVLFVDNWHDEQLEAARYWSADKLHLNALGHARVAANVLEALGIAVPHEWGVETVADAGESERRTFMYYREYVLPWIGRRLTGRSSGDGRVAKRPTLLPVSTASE